MGTVTFRYLLTLTQQAREEQGEEGACQRRPFCQGSHILRLPELPAPLVPTGSLSVTCLVLQLILNSEKGGIICHPHHTHTNTLKNKQNPCDTASDRIRRVKA